MNIHIQHFQPGQPVADEAALEQFQQQWATYQKLVNSDALSHKAVGKLLNAALNAAFTTPFAFLDIACGDASQMKAALKKGDDGRTLPRHRPLPARSRSRGEKPGKPALRSRARPL